MNTEFTKSDLKDGMIVELRGGQRRLLLDKNFIDGKGYLSFYDYNENLERNQKNLTHDDIVKIYKPKNAMCLGEMFYDEYLELIWERKEVDWSKVPVDTKIYVRDSEERGWKPRYFAKYENGIVYAFTGGLTSFSDNGEEYCSCWKYAKLAEEEEINE